MAAVSLVGSPDPTVGSMYFTNTSCRQWPIKKKIIKENHLLPPQFMAQGEKRKLLRTRLRNYGKGV